VPRNDSAIEGFARLSPMENTSAPAETVVASSPLTEVQRSIGAHHGVWFGARLPDDFGDWRREYGFLRESVALLDKNYRAYLEFTGPDRVRYLNAILTNNVKDLLPNHGVVSLFLSPQGRIQAEIETYTLAESLFCVSFAMIRQRLIADLDKYIIMDDVTLTDRTDDFGTLALEGPKAAEITKKLTGIDLLTLDELEFREASVGDIPVRVFRRSPGEVLSAEFVVQRSRLAALWEVLEAAARDAGGGPVGYAALNALRLEQGIPWFSYDFSEKQIPHEAGLQDSHISYTKGCYTGQEIVERVRSRGQVNRVRVLLQFDAKEIPAAGTPLLSEGKEFGFVTRAAFSPRRNAPIGMGYARREKSAPGSELETSAGRATVIASPVM
jgi:folate-binding protein YgfZ